MKPLALFLCIVAACADRTAARPLVTRPTSAAVAPTAVGAEAPAPRLTLTTLVALDRALRPADPQRPDALLRIARAALELADDERAALDGADERVPWAAAAAVEGAEDAPTDVALPSRDPAALARASEPQRQRLAQYDRAMTFATEVLERRLREHPDAPRSDEASYALASALATWRREARGAYFSMIRRFPSSPWTAHAWVYFGDHYFERGEWEQAAVAFERAAIDEQSPVGPYATYKLGWVRINQSREPDAARAFAQAIARARRSGAATIVREAARDLAATLARSRGNASAALLEGLASASAEDPELLRAMLDRAMNELRDSDRGADAVRLWDVAAQRDPRWGCEREPQALEAASSDAALIARVTTRRAQLACQ